MYPLLALILVLLIYAIVLLRKIMTTEKDIDDALTQLSTDVSAEVTALNAAVAAAEAANPGVNLDDIKARVQAIDAIAVAALPAAPAA